MSSTKDLTRKRKKESLVDSEYGVITYREWCLKEVKRVGRRCTYHEDETYCWIEKGEEDDKSK